MTRMKFAMGAAVAALLVSTGAYAEPGKGNGNGGGKAAHAQGGAGKAMKANGAAKVHGNGHVMNDKGNGAAKAHGNAAVASDKGNGAAKVRTARADDTTRGSRRVVRDVRADDFFDRDDEAAIRRYYGSSGACPPGLAAKNNGCLPPGQAKKTYGVGTILPQGIALAPLPGDLIGRLPVAPDGYYYGRYNGDVYLVENATRRIIDTIVFNLLR